MITRDKYGATFRDVTTGLIRRSEAEKWHMTVLWMSGVPPVFLGRSAKFPFASHVTENGRRRRRVSQGNGSSGQKPPT